MSKQEKNKPNKRRSGFKVYEPLIDYFEHNDIGEELLAKDTVEVETNITKRAYVINVKGETAERLLQIAHKEGISSTVLLQRWLKEKVSEYVPK